MIFSDLIARVEDRLSDRNRNEDTLALALSYFVKYQLALVGTIPGDSANIFLQSYRHYKELLLGFDGTTLVRADVKAKVLPLVSDAEANNENFYRAITAYLRYHTGRTPQGTDAAAQLQLYRELRYKLLGFQGPADTLTIRTAVANLFSDQPASEELYLDALGDYVKAHATRASRETGGVEVFNSYLQTFERSRWRLLGYASSKTEADLLAEVKIRLQNDEYRFDAGDDFLLATMRAGIDDIEQLKVHADTVIEHVKEDLESLQATVDAAIDQGINDIEGLRSHFVRLIEDCLIEMQRTIDFYREGHESIYDPTHFALDGEAMRANLPPGFDKIDEIWFRPDHTDPDKEDDECKWYLAHQLPWVERMNMVQGNCKAEDLSVAFDYEAKVFYIYPMLDEFDLISVYWRGVKRSFPDAEETPFTEDDVPAISYYVEWHWADQQGNKDRAKTNWINALRERHSDFREKRHVKSTSLR